MPAPGVELDPEAVGRVPRLERAEPRDVRAELGVGGPGHAARVTEVGFDRTFVAARATSAHVAASGVTRPSSAAIARSTAGIGAGAALAAAAGCGRAALAS